MKIHELGEEKIRLIEALLIKSPPSVSDRVNEWISALCKSTSEIAFKLLSKTSITVGRSSFDGNIFAFDFGHPLPVGVRGKSGGSINPTVLVDNENELNKISLDDLDSIKIELDSNDYRIKPLAVLIGENGASYISEMREDAGVITCDFNNLTSGEYKLYIQ
jgi:hypothetical protein